MLNLLKISSLAQYSSGPPSIPVDIFWEMCLSGGTNFKAFFNNYPHGSPICFPYFHFFVTQTPMQISRALTQYFFIVTSLFISKLFFSNIWRETKCPAWILSRTMAAHLAALEIAPTGLQATPNCANMDVTWIWVELTMTWLWAEPEGGAHKVFAAMWHWEMLMETVIHPKDSQRIQA